VGDVLSLAVRLEQGPDEEHRGPRRATNDASKAPTPRNAAFVQGVASRSPSSRIPPEITKSPPRRTMNET